MNKAIILILILSACLVNCKVQHKKATKNHFQEGGSTAGPEGTQGEPNQGPGPIEEPIQLPTYGSAEECKEKNKESFEASKVACEASEDCKKQKDEFLGCWVDNCKDAFPNEYQAFLCLIGSPCDKNLSDVNLKNSIAIEIQCVLSFPPNSTNSTNSTGYSNSTDNGNSTIDGNSTDFTNSTNSTFPPISPEQQCIIDHQNQLGEILNKCMASEDCQKQFGEQIDCYIGQCMNQEGIQDKQCIKEKCEPKLTDPILKEGQEIQEKCRAAPQTLHYILKNKNKKNLHLQEGPQGGPEGPQGGPGGPGGPEGPQGGPEGPGGPEGVPPGVDECMHQKKDEIEALKSACDASDDCKQQREQFLDCFFEKCHQHQNPFEMFECLAHTECDKLVQDENIKKIVFIQMECVAAFPPNSTNSTVPLSPQEQCLKDNSHQLGEIVNKCMENEDCKKQFGEQVDCYLGECTNQEGVQDKQCIKDKCVVKITDPILKEAQEIQDKCNAPPQLTNYLLKFKSHQQNKHKKNKK